MKYNDKITDLGTKEKKDDRKDSQIFSSSIQSNMRRKENLNIHNYQGRNMDDLQAAVVNAGMRILKNIEDNKLVEQEGIVTLKQVKQAVEELDSYTYNIGFAGEQSSGKSTVINSLIQYPLMPTCNLTTTSNCVKLVYGKKIKVMVEDEDTKKCVCDLDCEKISNEKFNSLKEYACTAMPVLVIENINYFTDKNIFAKDTVLKLSDLDMDIHDTKHVAVLALILFSTYIGQNDPNLTDEKKKIIEKRNKTMKLFGISKETVNYSVTVQWDCELLKSGLIITDLPGLGAYAAEKKINGKVLKSHADITRQAIQEVDAMVFIEDPTVKDVGIIAVKEMLSSVKLKEVVNKGERIIPILNKVDLLEEAQVMTSQSKFVELLRGANVQKMESEITSYSAIFGEYVFKDIPFKRSLYYSKEYPKRYKTIKKKAERKGCSEEPLKLELIQDLKDELEEKYNNSGIEQLREYFLTTYVNIGKYNRAVAAIQIIKNLALQETSFLETRAKTYLNFCNTNNKIQKVDMEKIKGQVKKRINSAIGELTEEKKNSGPMLFKDVEESITQKAPDLYQKAFEDALKNYKERLETVIKDFNLTWKGLGGKAQINIIGSKNRDTYFDLMKQVNIFNVDITSVNKNYADTLTKVRNYIDAMYNLTLNALDDLNKTLKDSIKDVIGATDIEYIADSMDSLRTTLLNFIDQQITVLKTDMKSKQKGIGDAGNDIVNSIMNLNVDVMDDFKNRLGGEINDAIEKGLIFSKREYLIIEGNGGLHKKISSLALDSQKRVYVDTNIQVDGSQIIVDKVINWIDTTNAIIGMLDNLYVQIQKMIELVGNDLTTWGNNNLDEHNEILRKIDLWKEQEKLFQLDVQKYFDVSLECI